MAWKAAKVKVKINKKDSTLTVKTDKYARGIIFDGDMVFEDNFFDLLPGEERTLKYECLGDYDPVLMQTFCFNGDIK